MVEFCCDKCGETLRKNQVDRHCTRCYTASVSCVGCQVSFYGDDFREHTTCVTEAERYEKKIVQPKQKKNETVRDRWLAVLQTAADDTATVNPAVKKQLNLLSTLDNVPRKERAFLNFARNSLCCNDATVQAVWKHLQDSFQKRQSEFLLRQQEQQGDAKTNDAHTSTTAVVVTTKGTKVSDGNSSSSSSSSSDDDSIKRKTTSSSPPPTKTARKSKGKKKRTTKSVNRKACRRSMKKILLQQVPDHSLTLRALRKQLASTTEDDEKTVRRLIRSTIRHNSKLFRCAKDGDKTVTLIL